MKRKLSCNRKSYKLSVPFLLSFLLIALIMTGCAHDLVKIHYEQVGACNGFNNGGGATSAGPKAAYAVFRIKTIENNDTSPKDFNFDPNLIYVESTTPRAFTNSHLNLAQINPFYATTKFVAKGTTQPANVGAVIAVVQTQAADGASEANATQYTLAYETPSGGPSVVLVKDNPDQKNFPNTPDCTLISY